MLIILLIAVLLFGSSRLPKLARSAGESMGEFKKGRQELEQEFDDVQADVENTVTETGNPANKTVNPGREAE